MKTVRKYDYHVALMFLRDEEESATVGRKFLIMTDL